jgi:ribosomal protein S17E
MGSKAGAFSVLPSVEPSPPRRELMREAILKMEVDDHFSKFPKKLESNFFDNETLIKAFQVMPAGHFVENRYAGYCLCRSAQEYKDDLDRLKSVFESEDTKHTPDDVVKDVFNNIFRQCLGINIQHLERLQDSYDSISDDANDIELHDLLTHRLQEVKKK